MNLNYAYYLVINLGELGLFRAQRYMDVRFLNVYPLNYVRKYYVKKNMCKAPDSWRFYNPDIYCDDNDLNLATIKLVSELIDIKDISKIREKLEHLENTKIFYCYYA